MYDLMKHADKRELKHLLDNIKLVVVPEMDYSTLPPTVRKPVDVEETMKVLKKYFGNTIASYPPGGH
jgi:hypothetical protein